MNLAALSATEAVAGLRDGTIKAVDLVRACLARIEDCDSEIRAWTVLEPEHALQQAKALDDLREAGGDGGPLHGVPVAVKDIFDTREMPTENGSVLDAGRQPTTDCTAVALLKRAGAVIMGKTVSTEFALFTPGKTRNPHNPAHTPGGSSSGSAAAVAAGMVPLALGSQTAGSVIRPAAYCGVCGYKPTHGMISRHGVLTLSDPLDHVGVFARTVEDLALIGDVLAAYDAHDPAMQTRSRSRLSDVALSPPPLEPLFAFVKSPVWDQAEPDTVQAFDELVAALGDLCDEVELPEPFAQAADLQRRIMLADVAKNLGGYYERGAERLSATLRGMIEEGQGITAVDYNKALDWVPVLNAGLDRVFERYNAILTPAAPGPAPAGLEATGKPAFNILWTLCGTPTVSLPLLTAANGMPMGVQLVGRRGDDARLLRTAAWLARHVQEDDEAVDSRPQRQAHDQGADSRP